MNNWCICWFFTHSLLGILIFEGLTARRLYKSFSVNGLIMMFKFNLLDDLPTAKGRGIVSVNLIIIGAWSLPFAGRQVG
jgi:hypothetical protein